MKPKAKLVTSAVFVGALLALPMAGCADTSGKNVSMKEQTQDAWITTKIKAEFAKDKLVSATNIHVDTDNGVVKLTGHAKNKAEVDKAVSMARNTSGVVGVKNEIRIDATGATGGASGSGYAR
jgi:osmotically-inducible protein OsmY